MIHSSCMTDSETTWYVISSKDSGEAKSGVIYTWYQKSFQPGILAHRSVRFHPEKKTVRFLQMAEKYKKKTQPEGKSIK